MFIKFLIYIYWQNLKNFFCVLTIKWSAMMKQAEQIDIFWMKIEQVTILKDFPWILVCSLVHQKSYSSSTELDLIVNIKYGPNTEQILNSTIWISNSSLPKNFIHFIICKIYDQMRCGKFDPLFSYLHEGFLVCFVHILLIKILELFGIW